MAEVDQAIVDEVVHEGSAMTTRDLFSLLERHHHDGRPGIAQDTLVAYADALADREDFGFDPETFLGEVQDQRTDREDWAGDEDRLYEVGEDRYSLYPEPWHDRLGGSTDVVEYLRLVRDEVDEGLPGQSGAGDGVPKDVLTEVIMALGRVDRETARGAIEAGRDEGTVVEDADQHPQADVYLAEEAGDLRDPSLD